MIKLIYVSCAIKRFNQHKLVEILMNLVKNEKIGITGFFNMAAEGPLSKH